MPKKALDLLVDSLDRKHVTTLRLLSGPANVTDKAKRAFERFKEELRNEGITAEWRVLPPEAGRDLHARVIFDEQMTYEMPPVNSVLAGTVDSIRQSDISHAPFETAWDGEGTLSLGDFVPGQAAHKKRDSASDEPGPEESLGQLTSHLRGQQDLHDEQSQSGGDGGGVRARGEEHGSASESSLKKKHRWTADELVASIREKRGVQAAATAEKIIAWVGDHDPPLNGYFGAGRALGSFMPGLERGGAYLYPVALFSDGSIEIQFQHMISRPQRPFEEVSAREEMRARLNEIPGVSISARKLDVRPSFSISLLVTDTARDHFLESLDWAFSQSLNAIDEARATMPSTGSISIELSAGAARHHYLGLRGHEAFFPADTFGGSTAQDAGNPISLEYTGTGETVQTDLNDQMEVRARGQLRRFYQYHHLAPRDTVRLERTGDRAYRVEALTRDPTRVPLPGIVERLGDQEIGRHGGALASKSEIASDEMGGDPEQDPTGRAQESVRLLIDAKSVRRGTKLALKLAAFTQDEQTSVARLVEEQPSTARAVWVGVGRNQALRWEADGQLYAPTTIVKRILAAADISEHPVAGPRYWQLPEGLTLAEKARQLDA